MATRLLNLLTLSLGVLGVVVCIAAAVVAWMTGVRLHQINDRLFDRVDQALVSSRDRVLDAQKRVEAAKITTEDVRQGVQAWARREAKERIASRPEVDRTVDRLAGGLQQADAWMEMSGTSLQAVQLALETAHSLGAAADATVVDPWLERLGALRGQLTQATETVGAIKDRVDRAAAGETLEERISRLAQLALRVVATLGEIDSRLGQVADGLVATRARGQQVRDRTHRYILTGQVCALLLAAWMAAGQVSLGRSAMRRFRHGARKPSTSAGHTPA